MDKNKDKLKIELSEDVSNYVEKCWFEWNGVQKILLYITKNNACTEHIEYYTKLALEKNFILETAKKEVISNYLSFASDKRYTYEFDFDNHCVWYQEVK